MPMQSLPKTEEFQILRNFSIFFGGFLEKKTGKVIILQEDSMFGGIASDIAAMIMENCFEKLDAPVKRVASLDTPIPFAANLESNYLPKNTFKTDLLDLIAY